MSKWFSPALELKNLPACMEWQQWMFTGLDCVDCSQQRRNTSHLITASLARAKRQQSESFCGLSASQQPSMEGMPDKQIISVSIAISEWPVLVPVTSRCLRRRGSPIKKNKTSCWKPVITAIIHLDLIGVFKLCRWVCSKLLQVPAWRRPPLTPKCD